MKVLVTICRILAGIVFIYSGFVKGVDPVGSTLKFNDYFNAFGLGFLEPLSFSLAILLSSAEFVIGFCLVTCSKIKLASWGALIFMSVFTPLTLVLAIFNPVSDCGCFGDALVLTNWQTFLKNIVIIALVIFVFLLRKKIKSKFSNYIEWSMTIISAIFIVSISVYSYVHLPIIDFRPYHIGSNIPEKMTMPEDAEPDEYETVLYYKKNNVIQEFTLENYPWDDSTWVFVNSESTLIKEGFHPPIHDFNIISPDRNDITDMVLSDNNYSFLLISSNLGKFNIKAVEKANDLAIFCKQSGVSFYAITASTTREIEELLNSVEINFLFYTMDETTLKTIIRSNPGLLLLKEGTIIGKWHYNDFPEIKVLEKDLLSNLLDNYRKKNESLLTFLLISVLVLFLILYKRYSVIS